MEDKKIIVVDWSGKRVYSVSEPVDGSKLKWQTPSEADDINDMGIGWLHPGYIEVNKLQNKDYEYSKIEKFLREYIEHYADEKGIPSESISLSFINYGKTELVYVLSEPNGEKYTVLTKQPAVEFGKIWQEARNLTELKKVDKNVVAPIDYYKFGDQELYLTPYIDRARCIASDMCWGMYVPDPFYRFVGFTQVQERVVNSCMIAKLVSLYDFNKQEGIASCKLGGGDFMLPRGWENEAPTIQNTLNSLYLIAARERVNCSFDEYLDLIRDEFSRSTIKEKQENLILNHRGRVPMQMQDIENGIALGREIISKRTLKL